VGIRKHCTLDSWSTTVHIPWQIYCQSRPKYIIFWQAPSLHLHLKSITYVTLLAWLPEKDRDMDLVPHVVLSRIRCQITWITQLSWRHLIMTKIYFWPLLYYHKVVDSESEVVRNFTWAVLGMKDGDFWHLGGVTRWNSHTLIHTWTFLDIIHVALFILDKSMA
jgi:hypothetical protein